MKRFSIFFATIALGALAACQSFSTSSRMVSPTVSLAATIATPTPSSLLVQYLEFSDLDSARKAARFSLWLPGDIPDNLSFSKAWIADYIDGSQTVSLLYREPGDPMGATLKSLDIQMTETDQPLTLDSIMDQAKASPQDIFEVQVRGQTGYSYWFPSVAAGNSAVLTWREGTITFQISLWGDWPQPNSSQPHASDSLLLQIAESMQAEPE